MPSGNPTEHVSAFAVYKQLKSKNGINKTNKNKRKKSQQSPPKPKENLVRPLKKIKKQKTVHKMDYEGDDTPPKLVEIKPEPQIKKVKKTDKSKTTDIKDNPITEAAQLFKWLIAPMTPETFFEKHWEQQTLHIRRTKPKYYGHILDSARLDAIFRDNLLHYTKNVDVVSYENGVKEVFNQEGRAVPSALWDYYANGCSIRLLNPHTYNHKVHLLIATLQEYFGTMVGANVYLTPPGSQGFAPHFDDIEAFVVQLEGRKHWKLYHPKESDVLARDSSHNFKAEEIGKPFMELTLEAGDILFFPRGTIHEGRTDDESHSLHITISVYQHTAYADLMEHILPAALKKAAENDVEFRKGLPLNYLKSLGAVNAGRKSKERDLVLTNVKKLLQSLINYIDVDSAADQLGRKFMYDSMPPIPSKIEVERTCKGDGDFLQAGKVMNRVEIGLDTKVRLLRYHCVRLVKEENSAPKLYYNTENAHFYHGEDEQWLELDTSMVGVLSALQKAYPKYINVDSLPMEDAVTKLQLISDLWEHGLLVTEEPLPSVDSDADEESE